LRDNCLNRLTTSGLPIHPFEWSALRLEHSGGSGCRPQWWVRLLQPSDRRIQRPLGSSRKIVLRRVAAVAAKAGGRRVESAAIDCRQPCSLPSPDRSHRFDPSATSPRAHGIPNRADPQKSMRKALRGQAGGSHRFHLGRVSLGANALCRGAHTSNFGSRA
jgi:hypothetical protein